MSTKTFTKVLLLLYSLSIMGGSFMEVGHGVLHRIENAFHHHSHGHHHSLEDHHNSFDALGSSENDTAATSELCSYFLYFESPLATLSILRINNVYTDQQFFGVRSFSFIPFIPPSVS